MFKLKQHFITFIELLIAMALTSLVLSTLLYFYRDISWLNQDMEKSQHLAFRLSYVQNRLSDVLPHAISPRQEDKDNFFFFVSHDTHGLLKPNSPNLVFTYNFGPNLDPLFANHVLGRLYLDVHNNFRLSTFPSPKLWPTGTLPKMKNEILLENVELLTFNFYVPPDKDRSMVGKNAPIGNSGVGKVIDIQPKDSWEHTDWKSEYNQLPAMIKITLKLHDKKDTISFIYPLPMSDFTIIYDK